jgi:membrane-bound lytic murein transglycosylase A
LLSAATPADARRGGAPTPLEITNSQYVPLRWSDVPGWTDDDQLAAFRTFLASCKPIVAQREPPKDPKALGMSLQEPCRAARAAKVEDAAHARAFFERHFSPLRISRL